MSDSYYSKLLPTTDRPTTVRPSYGSSFLSSLATDDPLEPRFSSLSLRSSGTATTSSSTLNPTTSDDYFSKFLSTTDRPTSVESRFSSLSLRSSGSSETATTTSSTLNPSLPPRQMFSRLDSVYSSSNSSFRDTTYSLSSLYTPSDPPTPLPRTTSPSLQLSQESHLASGRSSPLSTISSCLSTPLNLNPNAKKQRIFFAAMRCENADGTNYLLVIDPKSGDRFNVNEMMLEMEHRIVLGDFFNANVSSSKTLNAFRRTEHDGKLTVTVKGNLALVNNVRATNATAGNTMVFRSKHFADALSAKSSMPSGQYNVTIQILKPPAFLANGSTLHFQATNPKFVPIKDRALVVASFEKDNARLHFLWLLDRKEEGFFRSEKYMLERGHFFEGTFKKNLIKQQWTCVNYEKALSQLIEGNIEADGTMELKVVLKNYQAAGQNRKYGQAEAKFIGLIVDVNSILTPGCDGKTAKIRRQRHENGEFLWVPSKILE